MPDPSAPENANAPGNAPGNAAFTTVSLKPGDKVDAFTVVATIATTGSAVVYKAHDTLLDRHVAIKQIILGDDDSDDALRKRIRDEATIHKRVSTTQPKHLIQFIDAVDDDRGLMLVSEYYPSTSLEDMLDQADAPLEERQALGIVAATAKGLEAIHAAGVVHRDLKPSNILLGDDGGLKICDFGLAALIESQDSLSLGSVRYMAPELLRSEPADGRADVYSLGIIAYEMLAGRPNFDVAFRNVLRDQRNQAMRWMKWHTNARVSAPLLDDYLPDMPTHLVQLVARMMDKDQARRVGSAADVVEAIRRHFTGDGPDTDLGAHPAYEHPGIVTSSPGDTAPLPTRSKLPLVLAALLLFWVVVGTTLFVINDQKQAAAHQRAVAEANQLIDEGIEQYNEGNFGDSLENYQAVLAAWPAESSTAKRAQLGVWKASGRIALAEARYDEAVEHFERYRAAGGDPTSVEQLIKDARLNESFTTLSDSIRSDIERSMFSEALANLNDARDEEWTEDQESRLDALETLIGERRAAALAGERIAEAKELVEAGDRPAAIATLADLVSLPPEGQALLDQLREDEAHAQAMAEGEEFVRTGKLGQAIDAFKVALSLRPDEALEARLTRLDARRLTLEAATLFDNGQFAAARERLESALELDPDNADAGQLKQQIVELTELDTITKRGDAAVAAANFAGAIAEYEKALAIRPDNDDVSNKLNAARVNLNLLDARAAIEAGDVSKARALLEAARRIEPTNQPVNEMLAELEKQDAYAKLLAEGDAAFAAKNFGLAKRKYREAAKLMPGDEINLRIKDADHFSFLAEARKNLDNGELDPARAYLGLASEIRSSPELEAMLEELEKASSPADGG